jgi:hypothetical protein
LAEINNARLVAEDDRNRKFRQEFEDADKNIKDAKKKLEELRKEAAEAAEDAPPGKEWFKGGNFGKFAAAGLEKGMNAMKPQSFFDPRLAAQMVGATDVDRMMLSELKDINDNTRKRGGGLVFI